MGYENVVLSEAQETLESILYVIDQLITSVLIHHQLCVAHRFFLLLLIQVIFQEIRISQEVLVRKETESPCCKEDTRLKYTTLGQTDLKQSQAKRQEGATALNETGILQILERGLDFSYLAGEPKTFGPTSFSPGKRRPRERESGNNPPGLTTHQRALHLWVCP